MRSCGRKVLLHGEAGSRLEERITRIRTELEALAGEVRAADASLQGMFEKAREQD